MVDLKEFLKMADIHRCSSTKLIRVYDLMRHSYMVGIMFQHFAKLENIAYDTAVLEIVLKHDLLEVKTGDLLNPVKSFSRRTKSAWNAIEKQIIDSNEGFEEFSDEHIKNLLTEQQHNLFKCCDYLASGRYEKIEDLVEENYQNNNELQAKFNSLEEYKRNLQEKKL